nr:hypothetical protein [Angustibacter aerolatus]
MSTVTEHASVLDVVGGSEPDRRRPAAVPARPARRRPGRPRVAGRRPAHAVGQDDVEGVGDRHGDLDGRPHHARGRRHPRQGAGAVREGGAPRPVRPVDAHGGRGLRLQRPRVDRRGGAARHRHPRRRGGHGVPVRPGHAAGQARRRPRRGRGRGRRDRHGHRPRGVPVGPLPAGARRDRRREAGVRRRAPQGDPGDRRACRGTTTCGARRGSRCSRAPTSSRPAPARCSPPPRSRS